MLTFSKVSQPGEKDLLTSLAYRRCLGNGSHNILPFKNNYCTSWPQDSKQLNNNGMLLEDDRPVVPGVTVKAATVDALVDLLIESFLPTGGLKEENSNFARVMLLMHQWFTSSENLAHCLISRYPF
ncbi:hypothetical protein AVEN_83125-1 [Araneus ventricosus]|uniref:N-terminal Ras-GEF domain-containing protein n=1 Tax=Araneus ventricosus TaxID=182803 RepID=A0A4Y2AP60_ARAVE|nr:hypothetical protein AVEN_83125-1 [Araneus ventricosus]